MRRREDAIRGGEKGWCVSGGGESKEGMVESVGVDIACRTRRASTG